MQIGISPSLFAAFPGYVRHVLIAQDLDNGGGPEDHPGLVERLRACEEAVRADAACQDPRLHPRLAVWREAFQTFGANPNKNPPSIVNLVKRVRSGTTLPFINL